MQNRDRTFGAYVGRPLIIVVGVLARTACAVATEREPAGGDERRAQV